MTVQVYRRRRDTPKGFADQAETMSGKENPELCRLLFKCGQSRSVYVIDALPSVTMEEIKEDVLKVFKGKGLGKLLLSRGETVGSLQDRIFKLKHKQIHQIRLPVTVEGESLKKGQFDLVFESGTLGPSQRRTHDITQSPNEALEKMRATLEREWTLTAEEEVFFQDFSEEDAQLTFQDLGVLEKTSYAVKVMRAKDDAANVTKRLGHWEVSRYGSCSASGQSLMI